MKLFFTKNRKKNKGFTLLEALVSIGIFTMSVLAMLSILAQGISNTNYAKKKIIASYLAQEGVEQIRNIRDTTVISNEDRSAGWAEFKSVISDFCGSGCYLQEFNLPATCTESCPPILYHNGSGIYNYVLDGGVESGYVVTITVESVSDDEVKVNSTVSWDKGSTDYSLKFSDNLFNWIE